MHLFNPSPARITFFNEKVSLKVEVIRDIQDLKNNYIDSYRKIINSNRLVCNLSDYENVIRPTLNTLRKSEFKRRLKIIIYDENSENLHRFASGKAQEGDELI